MKIIKAVLLFTVFVGLSYAEFPAPEKLIIYRDTALLVCKFSPDLTEEKSVDINLPLYTDLRNLKMSVDKNCQIGQIKEGDIDSQIKDKIKKLEDQIRFFKDQIKTVEKEISLLEKLDINKTGIKSLDLFSERYFKKLQEKRTAQQFIAQLKDQIEKLRKRAGRHFVIDLSCKDITRPVINITIQPPVKALQKYTIYGDTENNVIKITNRIFVRQDTGFDLKGIELVYYSYRKTPSISPPKTGFIPFVEKKGLKKIEREYVETTSKAYFSVKNVDLQDGKENLITLSSVSYPAEFSVFIDGDRTVTPFLKATFKTDRFYPSSYRADFYIDGVYIGSDRFKPLLQDVENSLFFGEDIFINVSKEKIKDFTEKSIFGTKKTTKEWRYQIKNNHKKGIKITVVDKIPVSTSEKTQIKPFSSIKWKKIKPDGTIVWEFFLSPSQEKIFSFGYIITEK
ncbi:DUF4139 domain-containing protein [Persephonella sp.]|uniref:DUF4139 domain-containing protein n=1 Tax=Persephonella sp. TaxID=2060922 RepID=UPI0025D2C95A|nr:DUF4139 domain-containing protein [Persephonella sp.]